jgi:hypothetical protein
VTPDAHRVVRWVLGLVMAAVLVVAGVTTLLVGVAVAVARDSAGAGLAGQAPATVLEARSRGSGTDGFATDLEVRFTPAGGAALVTGVRWNGSEAPRVGDRFTVAYDPGDPDHVRPFDEIDPTGGWAAEWHPAPWIVSGALCVLLALLAVWATSRWARRAPASPAARVRAG